MIKRCKGCSTIIDTGLKCDDCYKPNVFSRVGSFVAQNPDVSKALEKDLNDLFASKDSVTMTLPTDSAERKEYPLMSGCLNYFPAALAGVANISKKGNDKHNPGQPLHHARSKSMDHGDCIIRHLMDVQDLLSKDENNKSKILEEVSSLAWRALALSQELHEKFGAPLAPGAKV